MQNRHLAQGLFAVLAVFATKTALLVLTRPYSVVTFSFETWWHWPVACIAGVAVLLALRPWGWIDSKAAVAVGAGAAVVSSVVFWLGMQTSVANEVVPGLWIK